MLDRDVPRIRVDRLRDYIEKQRAESQAQRRTAIESEDDCRYCRENGKIEAYDEILRVVEQRARRYEKHEVEPTGQDHTDQR